MAAGIPEPTEAAPVVVEEAVQTEAAPDGGLAGHQITEEDVELARAATADPTPEVEEEVVESEETPETPEDDAEVTPEVEVAESTEEPLIDISTMSEEFNSPDGPSDETRQALIDALGTKFANPEAIIDQFVAGAHASAAVATEQAHALAGGTENYNAMIGWASSNLDEGSRNAFNEAIQNPAMSSLAIQGLHAQFALATGQGNSEFSPQRVAPAANVSAGVKPVTSTEQIAELTGDPRFDRDPAFRASVEQRILAGMKRS